MKQAVQYQKTGELMIEDFPEPQLRPCGVLVQNVALLISASIEKSKIYTVLKGILQKAKS